MKRKTIYLSIVGIGLIALMAFKLAANKSEINMKAAKSITDQQYEAIPVKTAIVKSKDISSVLSESGTFKAFQELELSAQSQGQITQLLVSKSQFVRRGTLLAVIDNSSLISQTEAAQSALKKAREDAKRYSNALEAGGVSAQQLEEAQLKVQNAESQLASLNQQARNFRILAPMNGVINEIYVEAGSFVSTGTKLIEIVDITKVNLAVSIEQKNLPELRIGQKVNVSTDVYPDKVFNGKVATINAKTDLSQKIEVGITIDNSEKTPLLDGMYGHAQFITDKNDNIVHTLVIPREAIIGSLQHAMVFVVNADNTVSQNKITVGQIVNGEVEVISGLTENQQVVIAGQINLENDTKVLVRK